MTFEFKPAIRENVSLLIALAGASGSGKTFSALRLAKGMAAAGKIALIDTEARRALHYAGQFNFMHLDMPPPFKPERFTEAVHEAEHAGAEVVIVDSFSHEYDGVGGLIEWADELAQGVAKVEHPRTKASKDSDWWKDWLVKPVDSPGNWKEPKISHRKMVSSFLQSRSSLIFCLRADEKIEIIRDGGKTQVRPLGWTPICEKRFMYEMTASFTLTPDRPGRPHFGLPHKLQEQHRPMFPENQPIDEAAGRALAEWARGGAMKYTDPNQERHNAAAARELVDAGMVDPNDHNIAAAILEGKLSLEQQGHECAGRGLDVLRAFWANLTPAEKQEVGGAGQLESWKRIASEAKP